MPEVELTDDGGWCWFQDPRAVHDPERDLTYAAWVTRAGDVELGVHDHAAAETTTAVLHAGYERDDHDAPGLHLHPDGRVTAFYTEHGGPAIDYRTTRAPADLGSLGPERSIAPSAGHTYPNPRLVGGRLRLFYRNADGSLAYVTRDPEAGDDPAAWSDGTELLTTGGRDWCVYFKLAAARDGAVDAGLTFAEGGTHNPHRDLRHVRFDGDRLRDAAGTDLGGPGLEFWDVPAVYESAATGRDAWVWDCATVDGAPEVAYAELRSETDHRYRWARWTGDGWQDVPLADAGSHIVGDNAETYYSGGVVLDGERSGRCYCSVGDHGGSALVRLDREGGSWEREGVADGAVQNVRPVVPRDRAADLPVLWMRGRYTHFADGAYETAVVG